MEIDIKESEHTRHSVECKEESITSLVVAAPTILPEPLHPMAELNSHLIILGGTHCSSSSQLR